MYGVVVRHENFQILLPTQTMYVRIRGKSVGPLDEAKLQELVRQNKISRASEVSTDGEKWIRASEMPSLFTSAVQGPPKESAKTFETMVASEKVAQKDLAELDDPKKWFYSIDGRVGFGPLARAEIGHLIIQGTLNPDTLVWKQGEMADTVRYTSDFAEFLTPNSNAIANRPTQIASRNEPDNEPSKPKRVTKKLLQTTLRCGPWVMFLAIIASICVASVAVGLLSVFLFFVATRTLIGYTVIAGIIVLGIIVMLVMPLRTLWKLNSSIASLAVNGTEENLIDFMERLYQLIRSIVIHIIMIAVFVAVGYLLCTAMLGFTLGL